jgi:arylsulfatase A-like enzyme
MDLPNRTQRVFLVGLCSFFVALAWLVLLGEGLSRANPFPQDTSDSYPQTQDRSNTASEALHRADDSDRKPINVILIVADDLGYGSLGSYGQPLIKTPHTDRLATEGMRFSSFYSGASACSPSREALMTGKHTGHTRIRANRQTEDGGDLPLHSDAVTLADGLKSAGYTTAMIGKWGLGDAGSEGDPSQHGFDYVFGYLNQVLAHNSFPEFLWRNGEKVYLDNEVLYLHSPAETIFPGLGSYSTKQSEFAPELMVEEAESFIAQNAENPFFLYFPTTVPHENGEAPEGEKFEVASLGIYESKEWPEAYKRFAALISHFDEAVGRIVEAVKAAGIADHTLILVTSDNGAGTSAVQEFFSANGPLRGSKFSLYEGAIRVPMIAYWPGTIEGGAETAAPFAAWDLFPTILEVAEVSDSGSTDGISFLPTLMGERQPTRIDALHWETPNSLAALAGRWKVILYPGTFRAELYDLVTDPSEKRNVASEHPEVLHALGMAIRNSHIEEPAFPVLPAELPIRVSLRQRLKLIVNEGLFFPPFWPPATKDSTRNWRQVVADEATERTQIETDRQIRNKGLARVAEKP